MHPPFHLSSDTHYWKRSNRYHPDFLKIFFSGVRKLENASKVSIEVTVLNRWNQISVSNTVRRTQNVVSTWMTLPSVAHRNINTQKDLQRKVCSKTRVCLGGTSLWSWHSGLFSELYVYTMSTQEMAGRICQMKNVWVSRTWAVTDHLPLEHHTVISLSVTGSTQGVLREWQQRALFPIIPVVFCFWGGYGSSGTNVRG